jgi:hypothetical protein
VGLSVRTDDAPTMALRDHLFGGVLIAEHGAEFTAICLSSLD